MKITQIKFHFWKFSLFSKVFCWQWLFLAKCYYSSSPVKSCMTSLPAHGRLWWSVAAVCRISMDLLQNGTNMLTALSLESPGEKVIVTALSRMLIDWYLKDLSFILQNKFSVSLVPTFTVAGVAGQQRERSCPSSAEELILGFLL